MNNIRQINKRKRLNDRSLLSPGSLGFLLYISDQPGNQCGLYEENTMVSPFCNTSIYIVIQDLNFVFGIGKKLCLVAKEYTVGRKACTIEITDDATVSRKHCQFLISKLEVQG